MTELIETEEVVVDPSIKLWYENPVEWLKGLRYDLKNKILPMAIKVDDPNKNEILEKLVGETAMGIWKITFTHSSVDPNGIGNYELPEKMGDTAMKTAYDSAVIQKFPGISEHLLTLLNNLYMSKPIQRKKSEELGLYKWLRTILPVNISIHEDDKKKLQKSIKMVKIGRAEANKATKFLNKFVKYANEKNLNDKNITLAEIEKVLEKENKLQSKIFNTEQKLVDALEKLARLCDGDTNGFTEIPNNRNYDN